MKVSNRKGITNQTGGESCVAHREMRDEALTGEPAAEPWRGAASIVQFRIWGRRFPATQKPDRSLAYFISPFVKRSQLMFRHLEDEFNSLRFAQEDSIRDAWISFGYPMRNWRKGFWRD